MCGIKKYDFVLTNVAYTIGVNVKRKGGRKNESDLLDNVDQSKNTKLPYMVTLSKARLYFRAFLLSLTYENEVQKIIARCRKSRLSKMC